MSSESEGSYFSGNMVESRRANEDAVEKMLTSLRGSRCEALQRGQRWAKTRCKERRKHELCVLKADGASRSCRMVAAVQMTRHVSRVGESESRTHDKCDEENEISQPCRTENTSRTNYTNVLQTNA